MHYLREHQFPNGDLLALDVANTYVGLHALPIYTVFYGSKDNDAFQAVGSEHFMSRAAADAAFETRVASADPAKPTSPHNDIYNIVVNTFSRYLGEETLRPVDPPKDWEGFAAHVVEKTFGGSGQGDFDGAIAALEGLTNTSAMDTNGRADVMVELPAWKLLELVTAIAALGMVVRQHSKSQLRVAA